MSNAKIKLSNYKISFKPLLIILSIAIVITVVMTIIIVGFVSSPFSISIVSKNKVINYQNREIKVVAKKNNNPYKNVSFSIVEDGGDQYNNFLELIIDDQAPAYCTIRLIENENNEPVTSFGTLASDSNYNHATTYFSIQAEFNESNITKSPSVVKKIKYGFYEIYDAFFYNRPITWKNPYNLLGVATYTSARDNKIFNENRNSTWDPMVDQFYDEATNQYINDYYRAVMVTKDNYPKFIDKINGGYINNGFAVINSDIDSSITNPSEIKYLKRLISNPQSLSFSFQFKYKDSPALEKEIGAKRMHVVKEDDVWVRICQITGYDLNNVYEWDSVSTVFDGWSTISTYEDNISYSRPISILQTTISSDKINWNTSADMITIPSYFYDSSNYYEIAEIKSTQAQNSFSTFSGNLFIEGGVKKIGENAFYNSSVKKVYIDEGVEEIGKNAFYNCSNITDIYLPSTIREIANNAFSNIATNAKIHLPNVSTLNYSMVKLPYHSVYDFAKQHSGIAAINDWVNGSQNTNISLGGKTFSTVFDYDIMKYDI